MGGTDIGPTKHSRKDIVAAFFVALEDGSIVSFANNVLGDGEDLDIVYYQDRQVRKWSLTRNAGLQCCKGRE